MLSSMVIESETPTRLRANIGPWLLERENRPPRQTPEPQAGPKDEAAPVTLTGKRVVIVEDEGITQMQLRHILRYSGLKVVGAASTGEAAIEVALRERPDIILMDINMPGQINGLEAAQRILSEYRTCVIMLTAYGEYEAQAQEIGTCGYIIKPIDSATLLPRLREAFTRFYSH